MKSPQTPRGTHDILGKEADSYLLINSLFAECAEAFNFKFISTPIFESLSVFDRTLGESSDIVSKEMYVFEDRGGDKLCLRPEGTASIVRAFLSNGLQRSLPLKLYYSGPMFRYERPQKGRYRQFHQLGIECLGPDDIYSDIEVLQFADEYLKSLKLNGKTELHINSLGTDDCRAKYRSELVDYYNQHKGQLSEDSLKRLETNPLRILDSKNENDIEINKGAPKLVDSLSAEANLRFQQIQKALSSLDIKFHINDKLVRGLDYYNHLVFEFKTDALGAQDAILSGGRYNNLVETMGGPSTPGIGFAAGVERLMMLTQLDNKSKKMIAIAPLDDQSLDLSLDAANSVRNSGFSAQFITSGNMSKRMKKANNMDAFGILLIGEDEIKNKSVTFKNFISSDQNEIKLADLESFLKDLALT